MEGTARRPEANLAAFERDLLSESDSHTKIPSRKVILCHFSLIETPHLEGWTLVDRSPLRRELLGGRVWLSLPSLEPVSSIIALS